MGQMERAANRIYGIERDRPTLQKYTRAFLLAMSVGVLFVVAFVLLAFGRDIGREDDFVHTVWVVVRWPVGLALAGLALSGILQYAPRRRQPNLSWLAFGGGIGVALWTVVTIVFGVVFSASSSFGDTYGPLAGIVALQLWSFFSAIAVLVGVAAAAQLEAVRAGLTEPAKPDPEEHVPLLARAGDGSAVVDARLDDARDPAGASRDAGQHHEPVGQRTPVLEVLELLGGPRAPELVDDPGRVPVDLVGLEVLGPELEPRAARERLDRA